MRQLVTPLLLALTVAATAAAAQAAIVRGDVHSIDATTLVVEAQGRKPQQSVERVAATLVTGTGTLFQTE